MDPAAHSPLAQGVPAISALDLATAAQLLFPGDQPTALVVCSDVDAVAQEAAGTFTEVWKLDHEALAYPNAELLRPILVDVLPAGSIVLFPPTFGFVLAPGLSVKLGATYVPDVMPADGLEGTTLEVVRQEFVGQVCAHVHGDISDGAVITVRPARGRSAPQARRCS